MIGIPVFCERCDSTAHMVDDCDADVSCEKCGTKGDHSSAKCIKKEVVVPCPDCTVDPVRYKGSYYHEEKDCPFAPPPPPPTPPRGVFVPVPTFFKPASASSTLQPAIDIETQVAHSIYLAKNGIRGLVLLGSTGEAIHLSKQERFDVISGVRKGLHEAGFPKYPIMAGVLINSVDEVLEWLHDFKKAGADWGLVLAPGYFGAAASQENIREWYTVVADNSPIPILIYNYPGVTNNVTVTPETYTILAQHPNIVGCKMSHGNVSHHVQVSLDPEIDHRKFRVYSGFGQQLGPIVYFGAAGVIDGLAAIYPKTVARLMQLAEKKPNDDDAVDEMYKLQFAVSSAEEFVGRWGIVGIKEGVQRVLGMGTLEGGRLPLKGKLPEGEWEKWDKVLGRIQKIEESLYM